MDTTTVQAVSAMLDEFAARFGATGAHLWGELVRYTVVGAVADVFTSVIALAALAALTVWFCRLENARDASERWDPPGWGFGAILCGIGVIISGVTVLGCVGNLARAMVAPEAATLKALLP